MRQPHCRIPVVALAKRPCYITTLVTTALTFIFRKGSWRRHGPRPRRCRSLLRLVRPLLPHALDRATASTTVTRFRCTRSQPLHHDSIQASATERLTYELCPPPKQAPVPQSPLPRPRSASPRRACPGRLVRPRASTATTRAATRARARVTRLALSTLSLFQTSTFPR